MDKKILERKYKELIEKSNLEECDGLVYDESAFIEVVSELAKDCLLVSTVTIGKAVSKLLRHDLKNNQISLDRLHALSKELMKDIKSFEAYVLLHGIELENHKIELGRFTIYSYGFGPLFEELPDNKSNKRLRKNIEDAGCYIRIQDIKSATPSVRMGESDVIQYNFVIEEAYRLAQDVKHILNLYNASIKAQRNGFYRIKVAELVHLNRTTIYREQSEINHGFIRTWNAINFRPYKVNQNFIEDWINIESVIKIFNNKEKNPKDNIEQRIKRAIIWYSKGLSASDIEEQFVNFAIALESLLVADSKNSFASWQSITQKLADRVCFLLGTSYDERIEIHKEMRNLYNKRSKVVHAGKSPTQKELIQLSLICRYAILALLNHNFENWKAFEDWLKKKSYGYELMANELLNKLK